MKIKSLPSQLALAPSSIKTISGTSWRSGKSSAERGYGHAWRKARAGYLLKKPFCVMCLDQLRIDRTLPAEEVVLICAARGLALPTATVVDHIVPHHGSQSLFWDKNNWQPLCSTHHSRDKQREESSFMR